MFSSFFLSERELRNDPFQLRIGLV
jgi:hypothetical protein